MKVVIAMATVLHEGAAVTQPSTRSVSGRPSPIRTPALANSGGTQTACPASAGCVYAVVAVWTWIASSAVPSVAPMKASVTPPRSQRGDGRTEASSVLGLELAVVVANEGPDVIGHVEQLAPLLLVQRDGEAPEPVDGHAPLLAHPDGAATL